jgi:hypothetical protein
MPTGRLHRKGKGRPDHDGKPHRNGVLEKNGQGQGGSGDEDMTRDDKPGDMDAGPNKRTNNDTERRQEGRGGGPSFRGE